MASSDYHYYSQVVSTGTAVMKMWETLKQSACCGMQGGEFKGRLAGIVSSRAIQTQFHLTESNPPINQKLTNEKTTAISDDSLGLEGSDLANVNQVHIAPNCHPEMLVRPNCTDAI
jgi:fructose-1-phosphate kinase PfkB-like protein